MHFNQSSVMCLKPPELNFSGKPEKSKNQSYVFWWYFGFFFIVHDNLMDK